ncbi:xanthine dehydrogenase small subunit [Halomonas sp. MCCC 1A11057]|jgi:xanthine dehydrogenase small subunit|uniref:xanthine dehydrogenase small subunit n=1 Tax=Halomonas sp. MCCC 1A11057 TaxID=2733482 RepID=UPI001F226294|nr:xanthine dehydrogenase small subunit [Halomonas sp. MCCC 1A11057]MCE8031892.1 xanthine dehydrogenase small subunit [Halomonas sp. MCCC 1A11057]
MIDFMLNGQPCRSEASPETSVLELLRETLAVTGTKEGCASGDCGACTVAIGEPGPDGELHYHSANACITPAHQLNGRHLVTVDGLAQGDALHPAQAAMVACHGSQCGFCTPGIVMSLFTLHEQQRQAPAPLTPQRLEATLGGNLCRCTGYRPIRDAALSMDSHPDNRPLWLDAAAPRDSEADKTDLDLDAAFLQPSTLAALTDCLKRHPKARLVAGATDLWLESTQRLVRFEHVIDVTRVAELNVVEETELQDGRRGWWIGAAVTYSRLEPLLEEHYDAFAHLLHRLGSQQVRNRGTLGGNVANASPIGDTPPVLLALGSRLRLVGPEGERELPLEEFFLDYKRTALREGEAIRAIFLPHPEAGQTLKVWKLSKRREDDISAVLGAFAYRLENGVMRDVRLAFGGMAAIPKRAANAEAALEGQAPDAASFRAAREALAEDFQPMSDVRGSAEYRRLSAANLLERLRLVIAQAETDSPREVMLHAYAH